MRVVETSAKYVHKATEQQRLEVKEKIKKMRKEGEKLIKGMFEFVDAGGGWLDFSYKFLPGDPVRTVRINHGEICDLPMILVKHLNNCVKKIRVLPDNLDTSNVVVTKISRTRFVPMEMM